MGLFTSSGRKKNTRSARVSRMRAKIKKLEKAKNLKIEEVRLKAKLNSLRK
jgi:hypothetical protein